MMLEHDKLPELQDILNMAEQPWKDEELEGFGLRSILDGGTLFCGVMETFAINGVTYQWPRGSTLTWGMSYSKLGEIGDLDLKEAVTMCLKEISDCCDIKHRFVKNQEQANIWLTLARMDGPSGVLADMQIPVNAHPERTQLVGRHDSRDHWGLAENPRGFIDYYRVTLHELEHAHGLGHKPANINDRALIEPHYSMEMRHLLDADKRELVRRYGESTVAPEEPKPDEVDDLAKCIAETIRLFTPEQQRAAIAQALKYSKGK